MLFNQTRVAKAAQEMNNGIKVCDPAFELHSQLIRGLYNPFAKQGPLWRKTGQVVKARDGSVYLSYIVQLIVDEVPEM